MALIIIKTTIKKKKIPQSVCTVKVRNFFVAVRFLLETVVEKPSPCGLIDYTDWSSHAIKKNKKTLGQQKG